MNTQHSSHLQPRTQTHTHTHTHIHISKFGIPWPKSAAGVLPHCLLDCLPTLALKMDSRIPSSERQQCLMCEHYSQYLHGMLVLQDPILETIVTRIFRILKELDEAEYPGPVVWSLSRFGSRVYGAGIPSSDVDIVCELLGTPAGRVSVVPFLKKSFYAVRANDEFTAVQDMIVGKYTVRFKHLGQLVDFTAHEGDVATGHSPTMMSTAMKQALDERPPACRHVLMLVVDTVKRYKICFDGKGAIGKQLKAVHVAML